jgi:hypothetical protein
LNRPSTNEIISCYLYVSPENTNAPPPDSISLTDRIDKAKQKSASPRRLALQPEEKRKIESDISDILKEKGKKSDWRIKNSDIEYIKLLGKGTVKKFADDTFFRYMQCVICDSENFFIGNSGKVWRGLWKGSEVAIKVLKNNDIEYVEDFKKEFLTMR